MTKIELTKEERSMMVEEIKWEWDEEKLEKALEEFKEYLKSKQAKDEYKRRNSKKIKIQKYLENLKNLEDIKKLSKNEFKDILYQIYGNKRNVKKIVDYYYSKENEEKRIEFLMKLVTYDGEEKCPVADYLKVGRVSQILAFKEPYKFYIVVNDASLKGINSLLKNIELNDKEEDYPKWRPIFEDLRTRVNKVYKETLEREADFLDVDLFLWWLLQKYSDKSKDVEKESTKPTSETDKSATSETSLLSQYFQSEGFYFDDKPITAFYAALKTKGFVILSGLSGTGKTKLALLFAELLNIQTKKIDDQPNDNSKEEKNYIFLSVRPDWRDGKALLGYYNPLSEKYEKTELLKFIINAKENYERSKEDAVPYFIILDEMNLSHVEYYFADFLSILESGRDENGYTKESIKLHSKENPIDGVPSEIHLPPNLYIIGTVNVDETTYMFSPKVLDRAFTLEFREVDLNPNSTKPKLDTERQKEIKEELKNELLEDLKNIKDDIPRFCGVLADKEEIDEAIDELGEKGYLDELITLYKNLQPYDLHFGYRVRDEIALFVEYAINVPSGVTPLTDDEAFDIAVLMKVLPKFHGPRQKLEKPLWLVLNWCLEKRIDTSKPLSELKKEIWKNIKGQEKEQKELKEPSVDDIASVIVEMPEDKFKYPRTAKKVLTMLRQLYETGFSSFS